MPLQKTARQCNAKSKRSQNRCNNPAVNGNSKCRLHGGKSLLGVDSPTFKTGRFSIAFPKRIADLIAIAQNDSQLTDMREELATIDFWIRQRIEQSYAGETSPAWTQIKSNYAHYRKILAYLDSNAATGIEPQYTATDAADVLERIGKLITVGIETYDAFELVQPMLEQRRRIVETEIKRLKDLGQMIPAERAFAFVYRIVSIIKKYISDPSHLQAISREIAQAVNEKER